MRSVFALAAVVLVNAGGTVCADECDSMVARLGAVAKVTFVRRTELGTIHLKHPSVDALSIDCTRPAGRPPSFNATWNGSRPPLPFFSLIGQMGVVVLGKPAKPVEAAAKSCQRAALADAEGDSALHASGMEFDCSSFTQNGGGTHIAVRLEQKL